MPYCTLVVLLTATLVVCFVSAAPAVTTMYNASGHINGLYSSDWVPMTQSEALNYYTVAEICKSLQQSSHLCNQEPGDLQNYGMDKDGIVHANRMCSNYPGAFLRHHTISNKSHTIADLVKAIRSAGKNTIVFLGDSVSSQHFSDFVSGLVRVGFDVSKHPLDDLKDASSYQVTYGPPSKVPFFQVVHINIIEDTEPSFKMFHQLVSNTTLVKGKVVLIFNMGVHYNSENDYVTRAAVALDHLKVIVQKGHSVFYRETSAQHFDTENGMFLHYYDQKSSGEKRVSAVSLLAAKAGFVTAHNNYSEHTVITSEKYPNLNFKCTPIGSEQLAEVQNWRNRVMISMMTQRQLDKKIQVIPFFRLSAARYDFHVAAYGDCTHYCFNPMLWLPSYHQITETLLLQQQQQQRQHTLRRAADP